MLECLQIILISDIILNHLSVHKTKMEEKWLKSILSRGCLEIHGKWEYFHKNIKIYRIYENKYEKAYRIRKFTFVPEKKFTYPISHPQLDHHQMLDNFQIDFKIKKIWKIHSLPFLSFLEMTFNVENGWKTGLIFFGECLNSFMITMGHVLKCVHYSILGHKLLWKINNNIEKFVIHKKIRKSTI